MQDRSDGRVPQRKRRSPDSIWERYLTGQLSLEDKETLPALIKELHREIAQHLGGKPVAETPEDVYAPEIEHPEPPSPAPNLTPMVDIAARRAHIAKRRPIDPRQN